MRKVINIEDINLLEIGNTLEIIGVVYGGNDTGAELCVYLPDEVMMEDESDIEVLLPSLEEWQQIVRQSDLKEIEGMDKGKKIILRKSTRQIETKIMWEVYRRDEYTCRYCGANDRPLTVDHIVLWEDMGPSIPLNLISSCKKCNNKRGNMQYEDWLWNPQYLSQIPKIPVNLLALNALALTYIPEIKENHLRTVKRSR
jgi:hypothetical protein